jgi:uncharacterized protein involved in exopolysaccharide biosynthesis
MSRIDEALKRLAGVATPEPRVGSTLERYAPEDKPAVDTRHARTDDHHRIANFVAAGPRPLEGRAAPPKPHATPPPVAHLETPSDADSSGESEPLINVRQLFDYVGFVARSVGRHKLLAFGAVVLVLAFTGAAAVLLPRTYGVETKLLAQRNAVMAALSNPGRAVPWDADAPTRAAAETVLRRDNLIALIEQTDLMNEWERTRAPILKLKDWLRATVTQYTPTADDKLESMVGLLEARMFVEAGPVGDGTVTIALSWPDAEMAYRLVQAAQQAFLDARQAAETAAIGESIAILEKYSASLHDDINRTLAELERTQATASARSGASRPRLTARSSATSQLESLAAPILAQLGDPLESNPNLKRLKEALVAKRLELQRVDETRQRQLAELQGRLGQLKTVYTANHPNVVSVEQNIAALSHESPQAIVLDAEIQELQEDYDKRLSDANDLQTKSQLTQRSAAATAPGPLATARETQPTERAAEAPVQAPGSQMNEFVRLRLRSELNQLESVLERTDGAKIELAVSQAAFKYRYTVIRPAQVPRDPAFPNVKLLMAAGFLASLLFALAVVVTKDLLSNRILEAWQIERHLGLPVLGTLRTA